jgi:hypothetical protein
VFGRRRREAAAAEEAAREAERRALFAKLAERPEHICPFLGLDGDRTGYVDGISEDHRCYAFGDPAPLSAEQQTRVCQERGYGNCPRYLRGVLVIPTEELEALRRARPAADAPPPAPEPEGRRRGALIPILLGLLLLVGVGAGGGYLLLSGGLGTAGNGSDPTPTVAPTPVASAVPSESASAEPTTEPSEAVPTPTPEATPEPGDQFAFYEVQVAPGSYTIYLIQPGGAPEETRSVAFEGYSFAQTTAVESADADVYWQITDGDLAGYAYLYPESGEFRVRAVFLSDVGERRSRYIEDSELEQVPRETPAPLP